MSQLQPLETSVYDICTAALKECGAVGMGQTPTAEDFTDAWARLQWMLQEWNEDRYFVYHLVTKVITTQSPLTDANGVQYFPVGPGAGSSGGFETGANTGSAPNLVATSQRPEEVASSFLRQPTGGGAGLRIDYPLEALQSQEDYNRIALKTMLSFPGAYYYDPAYPTGRLYVYPFPQPSAGYSLGLSWREQLQPQFLTQATLISLPFQYYSALYLNLAVRLRPVHGIRTAPGDHLPKLAEGARSVLKSGNAQIPALELPQELSRPGIYNIFSDRTY